MVNSPEVIELIEGMLPEKVEWAAKNFPDESALEVCFGVIEEVGELSHAHLKELQGIRGTPEEHQAKAKDAIGDIFIYLLSYCIHRELDMAALCRQVPGPVTRADNDYTADQALLNIASAAGRLARGEHNALATLDVGYTARSAVGRIVWFSQLYCQLRGWDYVPTVRSIWNRVKQRDWVADPVGGGESD